ncbi:DNA gyrase subunit A [Desulfothermus okinawensis JCM 13304]
MLKTVTIEEEIKKSYLEYSLSVIIGRAIPDVRDGLKPVHRRILYAMYELGNFYNRPYKKSARIVGDVIGKYHPHGDSAVYDALVRMAQPFNMRDPLIDGQGNFGSIDGDAPAAMRYTECRMSRIAHEFIADIEKDTVNFRPNYDNSLREPEVLPTKIPNLIVNGASGIAVGMATNIPPHNLGEVIDGILFCIDNENSTIDQIMNYIKGPDFPTGAYMYGTKGLKDAYLTGRGTVKIRSKIHVETTKKGYEKIVITEIPYGINKANLLRKIAELVNENKIEGISDLRDESDRNGIRIVLDLKKNSLSDIIINRLYKYTPLDTSFGINFLCVVNNRPKLINIKEYIHLFINFRKEVVLRRTRFDLNKAQKRAHILEGLKLALSNIDEVIEIIKKSKNPSEAKGRLIERFGFTEVQSQAILDMKLQRLTNLEQEKILEEYKEIIKKIEFYNSIINNPEVLKNEIKKELIEIKEKYSTPRRTEILKYDPENIDIIDLIPDEEVVITLTKRGYIKRTPLSAFGKQRRGGKGISGSQLSDSDLVQDILIGTNHENLLLFTNKGRMLVIKVFEIPEAGRRARGTHVSNLLSLNKNEYITTALVQRELDEKGFYLFVTKKGMVKKTGISQYKNVRSRGIIAINLREDDELISVKEIDDSCQIMLLTKFGFSIRFKCDDIREVGRNAMGVKGISLRNGDIVVSCVVIDYDNDNYLITVTEKGSGKRTILNNYRLQNRGGKGIINIKPTEKTGFVVGGTLVKETDQILILTKMSKLIRIDVKDVNIYGRNAKGVKLINLDQDDKIIGFDKIST